MALSFSCFRLSIELQKEPYTDERTLAAEAVRLVGLLFLISAPIAIIAFADNKMAPSRKTRYSMLVVLFVLGYIILNVLSLYIGPLIDRFCLKL